MFFQNLSKRKILLLLINALISVLIISCVTFLYYYLPNSNRTFTVEKENTIHITKGSSHSSNLVNANVRISSSRRSQAALDRSSEDQSDDTIYIDNDNYGDENYDNSGNFANQVGERPNEIPVTAPVTIIERPLERSQPEDDDFYYENYDDESETDDEDVVSSGDGKIVVNIKVKKPLANRIPPPEPVNYIENVYSVSSEIVSNLKSQYSIEDTKQINKPDKSSSDSDSDKDDSSDDEWQEMSAKGKRLIGNNKIATERSRQLLLCESARTGELCRMLFKGTAG